MKQPKLHSHTHHHKNIRQGYQEVCNCECPHACADKESDTTGTKGSQK